MREASLSRLSEVLSRWSPRALATAVVVLVGAGLGLRILDAIPLWLSGLPRGVHACTGLDQAQARTGVRLGAVHAGLPGWQPVGVRMTLHPISAVAVTLRDREADDLVLYRSRGGPVPASLCAPLETFHAISVPLVQGRTATLRAEAVQTGGVLQEIEWTTGQQHTVMRFAGRTVQLLRLARQFADHDP